MNDRLQGKSTTLANTLMVKKRGHLAGCTRVFVRYIIGTVLVFSALPASSFNLAAPFNDPLRTLPKIIESGASLPGGSKPAVCPASADFSKPLLLTGAVDLALCNNPKIKSAWASIKVQSGALGEARAAYLPTLSGTTSSQSTHTAYPGSGIAASTTNGQTISGSLAWRFLDFGGRSSSLDSANSLLVAALALHDAALQKTLADVIQAYFDALSAKAMFQSKEQNEAIARNTLETAQRRETRGAVARGDTLQATTALAKGTLDRNRALGAYQKALSVLVYTLGVPMQTRVILPDDLNDDGSLESRSLDDWLKITEETHPAIRAARAQWKSSKYKITSTRSAGLPTVDVSASYYQNGYPGQGLSPNKSQVSSIGISLSIPLFDGFSHTYKIRGAEAQAEQSEAGLQDTEHNTLLEVVKAYADATASVQNLLASEELLSAAQDALNSSQRKYDKGAADILEILNTQAALSDALQERVRCLAEWRSAKLRLLANAGLLGREAVGN
jgi:outer membrane protein